MKQNAKGKILAAIICVLFFRTNAFVFSQERTANVTDETNTSNSTESSINNTENNETSETSESDAKSGNAFLQLFSSWKWCLSGGVQIMLNTDDYNSDPSPIVPTAAILARIPLKNNWELAPMVNMYITRYLWANERALPAALENRTALVPTILLDVPAVYRINAGRVNFDLGAGLAFCIRAAFAESVLPDEEKSSVKSINKYLWEQGRFLYPSFRAGITLPLENGVEPGLLFRAFVPVFNFWATPKVPFHDSMMLSFSLTLSW